MLNKELEQSLNKAFHDANEKRHEFITVEHLLLMLTENDAATAVIEACGADVQLLKTELEIFVDQNTPLLMADEDRDTQPTLGFQRVLQRALFHVQSSGNGEVSGANVLVAIFSEQDSHAVYLLNKHNIERLDVTNYLSHGITRVNDEAEEESFTHDAEALPGDQENSNPLEKFATNLNELAFSGKIDPLIGRDQEIERIIQTLCRRRKNNPLLVGEAGVGKTAIAEGLARKIVEEEVPEVLLESTVYALDLGALVAGTKYRGTRRCGHDQRRAAVDTATLRLARDCLLVVGDRRLHRGGRRDPTARCGPCRGRRRCAVARVPAALPGSRAIDESVADRCGRRRDRRRGRLAVVDRRGGGCRDGDRGEGPVGPDRAERGSPAGTRAGQGRRRPRARLGRRPPPRS